MFTLNATDNLIVTGALGGTWRPTPNLEFGANVTAPINIRAQGNAQNVNGPNVTLNGTPIEVLPSGAPRCADGGTQQNLKACVEVDIPMTAQIGGRYKVLDDKGKFKGDIEVDLDSEHWGAKCDYAADPTCVDPSDYHVVVDGQIVTAANPTGGASISRTTSSTHGLQDAPTPMRIGGNPGVSRRRRCVHRARRDRLRHRGRAARLRSV